MMNKLINIIVLTLSLFLFSSCGSENEEREVSTGKLIVGTSADNPPYEFIKDGEVVGFDIDLIAEIAKELNRKLIVKNLDFPGLLPSVLSRNVDMVIAALSITPERLHNVDFSIPYSSSEMAVLFLKDMHYRPENFAAHVIGVQFGTTWEEYVKKRLEGSEVGREKSLANNLALVQELINKNVDLVVMEKLQVMKFAAKYSELNYQALEDTKTEFAIALPKGSEFTSQVNEVIKKLEANGFIEKLKEKWLSE